MSTLRQLGTDRWEVRIYDATMRSGKRARSFRASGPADAKRKAPAVEAALREEAKVAKAKVGTVGDITRRWLSGPKAGTWSPTTRRRYEAIARQIVKDLGSLRADKVRAVDVDDWLQRVGVGKSPQTVAHYRAALRAIFRQAERWELIPTARAVTNSTPPRLPPRKAPATPDAVVELLLSTAGPELHAAAMLAAHGGLRRGEVIGVRWGDLEGDVLHVRRAVVHDGPGLLVKATKSGQERSVTLTAETLRALAALPRGEGFIFADYVNDPGGQSPRRPDWLGLAWKRLCARHGAAVRFHDLRHWHATSLLNAGVPIQVVSGRLGHAEVSTTLNIYVHGSPEDDRAAMEALPPIVALPRGSE